MTDARGEGRTRPGHFLVTGNDLPNILSIGFDIFCGLRVLLVPGVYIFKPSILLGKFDISSIMMSLGLYLDVSLTRKRLIQKFPDANNVAFFNFYFGCILEALIHSVIISFYLEFFENHQGQRSECAQNIVEQLCDFFSMCLIINLLHCFSSAPSVLVESSAFDVVGGTALLVGNYVFSPHTSESTSPCPT